MTGIGIKIWTNLVRNSSARLLSVSLMAAVALGISQAPMAFAATTTTISLASSEASVAQGNAVTLTARVTAGASPVTAGHVLLCSASAQYCQGSAILGQGQLTASGNLAVPMMLSVGTHSLKAIYTGTSTYAAATSAALSVTVTGTYSTSTALAVSGSAGNYSLQATVASVGPKAVSGSVSFSTTTGTESVLGTASLGAPTAKSGFSSFGSAGTGTLPVAAAVGDFNGDGIPDIAVVNSSSASLTILLGQGNGSFEATTQVLTTGAQPGAIAVGDFNNDGKQDLIVASQADNALYEFLGMGNGNFEAPTAPINETGSAPVGVVVGDFNRDGQQDLAVLNQNSNSIVILLGNGQGGFTPGPQTLTTDQFPDGIAIGDFNNDGSPDLISVNYYGSDFTLFINNGNGTFAAPVNQYAGVYPTAVAVGDFNNDGNLDFAVTSSYAKTVNVLLGNGQGGFTIVGNVVATEQYPDSITIADFNGDGNADMAVANSGSGTVDVYLGSGSGAFQPRLSIPAGSAPNSILAADWNGDGMTDLAVLDEGTNQAQSFANVQGTTAMATLTGVQLGGAASTQSVQGTFEGTSTLGASQSNVVSGLTGTIIATTTTETVSPTRADVDEGVEIVGSVSPASAGELMPTGLMQLFDGTSAVAKAALVNGVAIFNEVYGATGTHSFSVMYSGDQNFATSKSGATELTVATQAASTTTLTASAASVAHGTPVTLTATVTSAGVPVTNGVVYFCRVTLFCEDAFVLGKAQLNSSGQAKLTIALPVGANEIRAIFASTAAITYSSSANTTVTVTGTYPTSIALSNTTLNGATTGGVYSFMANLTNGSWQPLPAESLSLADTTSNNLVLASATLTASVPGLITKGTASIAGGSPWLAQTADFNGDGKVDIAEVSFPSNSVSVLTILLSNGDGTFTQKPTTFNLGAVYGMAVGDFNGDGKPDLALANYTGTTLTILLGNGDGTFTAGPVVKTIAYPNQIAVGDFNNDGKQDLVVSSATGSGLAVLMGNGDGTFTAQPELQTGGSYMSSIAVADFNGDGFADLVVADPNNGALALYGNGDGTFQAPQSLMASGTDGYLVAAADFDGDGRTDVAVYQYYSSSVVILVNTSTNTIGSFAQRGTPIKAGAYANNMVVADVNGDGAPDLITSDFVNANSFYVDINQGGENFTQQQVPVTIAGKLGFVAVGDFDEDGGPDLAVMGYTAGTVTTYLNRSTNTAQFSNVTVLGTGTHVLEETTPAAGVYTAGTSNTLSVSGKAAPVTLSPTSLAFGSETVGVSTASQEVTLTNTGSATLNITSIVLGGANASSFAFVNNCPSTLAAGANCGIRGHFDPTTTGALTATVTITDNAGGSPQTIALSGTGTGSPAQVTLSATSLAFGTEAVGLSTASQGVTLMNTGGTTLNISSIVLGGADPSSFVFANNCGSTLAIGANCGIHGHFSPTTKGALTATITITDSASGSPQTIVLSGTGD